MNCLQWHAQFCIDQTATNNSTHTRAHTEPQNDDNFPFSIPNSLCSALSLSRQHDTACLCCWMLCCHCHWALAPAINWYLQSQGAQQQSCHTPLLLMWWSTRQMDGQTLDRYTDPAPDSMWAVSTKQLELAAQPICSLAHGHYQHTGIHIAGQWTHRPTFWALQSGPTWLQWACCTAVLNIHDVMSAHNVPAYIATQGCALNVIPQVAAPGA